MSDTQILGIVAVPAILGLVQVLKDAGLPDRFAPLTAVLLGIAAGAGQASAAHTDILSGAIAGLALGLSACGLYSGASNAIGRPFNRGTRASGSAPLERADAPPGGQDRRTVFQWGTFRGPDAVRGCPLGAAESSGTQGAPANRKDVTNPVPTTWGTQIDEQTKD
ncbi:MAG: hypothetical protein JOZ41_00895 [Chloroflexi bacterium]|nr:hypothetical protein [Chloroflexota bacterium]